MLTVNKLEKIIELEEQLRAEYQGQLDSKSAGIENAAKESQAQQDTIEQHLLTIKQQLATITDLSTKATANQRVEQLNRELNNRTDKQLDEITELKKRVKLLQKDLAEERSETKALKQFDPARMKKNLDANKKKLAEKTKANEVLQKSLTTTKNENSELQQKVKELESKLADVETTEDAETEAAAA